MRGLLPQCYILGCLIVLLVPLGFCSSSSESVNYHERSVIKDESTVTLLPETSPTAAPQPFLPLLAPSPLMPFTNSTVPKLSGLCTLNFFEVESLMSMTSMDCVAAFAPYLANIICCPQLEATLVILIGQSSNITGELALSESLAMHCLADFEQILVSQGANDSLSNICSIRPSNLSEGACPVKDVSEFEATVNSSDVLDACRKIDLVNECCEQVCQNAISEAAKKLANKTYDPMDIDGSHTLSGRSTRVNDCKSIVLRWLASRLDPSHAREVLRGLSNCNINKVCPLAFPNTSHVINGCKNLSVNHTACCNAMESYVSHLQKQSFTTNLQALNCAASLGLQLQKANITENVYDICHISLKDFSLQVGLQESGCLLPSLPSDVVFDRIAGFSFLCDLNDKIPALWPTVSQVPVSSCNKTTKIPALPAATSGQSRLYVVDDTLLLLLSLSIVHLIFRQFEVIAP